MMLLAQAVAVAHWAAIIILIAAIVGITLVVIRETGIAIPPFVMTIAWIILACLVAIVAIRFLIGEAVL